MTSNVGQNYPYSSETEAVRASTIARLVAARDGLSATLGAESSPLDANDRWWVWKCPTKGCPVFSTRPATLSTSTPSIVVCDGTCAKTFLR